MTLVDAVVAAQAALDHRRDCETKVREAKAQLLSAEQSLATAKSVLEERKRFLFRDFPELAPDEPAPVPPPATVAPPAPPRPVTPGDRGSSGFKMRDLDDDFMPEV